MCGIVGILNYGNNKPVDEGLIKEMATIIKHRGPDGEGYYVKGNLGMGHRRLSIIDVAGGSQPIYNEDKSIVIVFNGEIYNFPELKKDLISKGHSFYTNTDTEVVIHLYEELGERCVDKLRGMFAFAIWDEKQKKLFIARDRVGIKPLYYYYDKNRIVFASELKSLVVDKTIPKEILPQALSDYFVYLCVVAPKTIFKNIYKLCAGNILICDEKGVSTKEYWDMPICNKQNVDETNHIERLNDLLRDAVRFRLISDVPLGAFLSGGLDSSTIVSLMKELEMNEIVTASIGFREKDFDESMYARMVAKHFSTKHYEEVVDTCDVEMIDDILWYLDEPFADASAIPTYNLSRITNKHVTVALSGDGSDEIFAGYRRYYYDVVENNLRKSIPKFARETFIASLASIYPKADWMPRFLRAKTLLTNLSSSQERSHFNSIGVFNEKQKNSILNDDIVSHLNGYDSFSVMEKYYKKTGDMDELSKILYVDFKTYLPDRMLVKVDRMSMAHSLEVRVPFLDHELLEYIAQIPSLLKLKGKNGKYILKKCMAARLPMDIISRRKKGFDIPLDSWFRNDLKAKAYETIFDKNEFLKEYCNYGFIKRMWDEHQRKTRNWGQHIWNVYVLTLWVDRFLKR